MADENTPKGESTDDEDLKNKGKPSSNTDDGQEDWKGKFEAAQKELTEMRMWKNRAAELKGQLEKAEETRDAATTQLEELKESQSKAAAKQAAQAKQDEILSDFKPETKELAKELGISLDDAEDEKAVEAFKAKLDKLEGTTPSDDADKKPKSPPVRGNNRRLDDAPPPKPKSEEDEVKATEDRIAAGEFDDIKL